MAYYSPSLYLSTNTSRAHHYVGYVGSNLGKRFAVEHLTTLPDVYFKHNRSLTLEKPGPLSPSRQDGDEHR